MDCRRCGTPLEKPGDYCLTCETGNCDAVVVVFERDRATLTLLRDEERGGDDEVDTQVVGETTVTTVPESGGERGVVELRNFAGRVADELRRKRPEEVYAAAVDG
ncbi:metal-binding protein, partial [Halobium palmae]